MAPNRPTLCWRSSSMVRSGRALPSLIQHSQPMSACMYSASKPTASSTRIASGRTWLPMPSPGMDTTLRFAMNANSSNLVCHPERGRRGDRVEGPDFLPSLRDSDSLSRPPSPPRRAGLSSSPPQSGARVSHATMCHIVRLPLNLRRHPAQPQLPAHQVLHSAGNHQRLWHAAQRREGELLACIANGTRGKIDLDLVTGNNRLFLARDRIGKLCAQPVHQAGRLDAEKAVVECVTQIGLREAARDHQWNALVFKRRHRLLATGTRAEIEAPDYDVSLTRAPSKLRIVILHHHARHHLRGHVFAIGVVLAVDAVGVQVVLRKEDQPSAHALRKSGQDFNLLGRSRTRGQHFKVLLQFALLE